MKREELVVTAICDLCGEKNCYNQCLSCGKDMCYWCEQAKRAIQYTHAVYFSGSGDGYYCVACNDRLLAENKDPLFLAYLQIKTLKTEGRLWNEDFQKRSKEAEEKLARLIAANKKEERS